MNHFGGLGLARRFKSFDLDGDGLITLAEFKTVMSKHAQSQGKPVNIQKMEKMFAKYDINGDGEVVHESQHSKGLPHLTAGQYRRVH